MKKLIVLFVAALFLCGCALSTIEPYKKTGKAPAPAKAKEDIAKPVEKLAPAAIVQEALAAEVETKEEVIEVEEEEIK